MRGLFISEAAQKDRSINESRNFDFEILFFSAKHTAASAAEPLKFSLHYIRALMRKDALHSIRGKLKSA